MRRLTPKQEMQALDYVLAMALVKETNNPARQVSAHWRVATRLVQLKALARALRKRFANECSYQWADTDKYRARTERMCEQAHEVFGLVASPACTMEINRDPRGAAIHIEVKTGIYGRDFYL